MLYLIATPIGNLGDITYRAVETLKKVDQIFCEDTRKTKILLTHYAIEKPLRSYHSFSEKKKLQSIILLLKEGKEIALLTDAGLPCVQDPGTILLKEVISQELPYTILPGASSVLQGYLLSGFVEDKFQFIGFFPKKEGKRKKEITAAFSYPGSTIAFESPHRLLKTLSTIEKTFPDKKIAICREMTKRYEEVLRGTATELLEHFMQKPPKGEITLVLEGL